MIFFGYQSPFEDALKNRLALFNEACVCFLSLTMVLETDFCDNLETRYYAGYMFLALLISNIAFNMFMMFRKQINFVRLVIQYIYNRFEWITLVVLNAVCPLQLRRMALDFYRRIKAKV